MKRFFVILCSFAATAWAARAQGGTSIYDLKVQGLEEPSAIEERDPDFSWKMSSARMGCRQAAYRITVRRALDGRTVWDSGLVSDSLSTGIRYMGTGLQACHDYSWTVEVTDDEGTVSEASSSFSTGIMDPRLSAWNGARWIGDSSPSLDAATLQHFTISSDFIIVKGTTAGFIFGADDFRLQNIFQNSFNLHGSGYFKVVMDFGAAHGTAIKIYRVGYSNTDSAAKPFLTIDNKAFPGLNLDSILAKGGAQATHNLKLSVADGCISFEIDGKALSDRKSGEAKAFPIAPEAPGGIRAPFPHLCSVGFASAPGSDVTYTHYAISVESRNGSKMLFSGPEQYKRFETLSCVRIPRYRNQSPYEQDIVVINKGETEVTEWIDPSYGGAKMLRTEFSIPTGKKLRKAKVYASALGVYELSINGNRVGDDYFAPGAAQYRERIPYQAYDVTSLLKSGRNALGAYLFEGWYSGYTSYDILNYDFYGDTQALLCRLDLLYEDGSSDCIVSSPEGWKTFDGGPVRAGSFFQGERYDAKLEAAVKGWDNPGFNDASWKAAKTVEMRSWLNPYLTSRLDGLVRQREVIQAVDRSYLHSNYHTYIYDMGVNFNGVPRITIPSGCMKKGDVVILRYAEELYPGLEGSDPEYIARFGAKGLDIAGHMFYENYRKALCADFYIAGGEGAAVISPRSTWRGYRYIQITIPSHEGPLPLTNVEGLVLSSCPAPTGEYAATSEDGTLGELATTLMGNTQRSQMSNFFTLPLDCPQRNERQGWTGDAQVFCLTSSYNADVYGFFRQWMQTLRDDQGHGSLEAVPGSVVSSVPTFKTAREPNFSEATTWAAAVCMVPYQMYRQYGDKRIVEENIDAMYNWLCGMAFYPLSTEYPHLSSKTGVLGDWLSTGPDTPMDLVNNAIYIGMMDATAEMARAIGREGYAAILEARSTLAKEDWNRAYVDPETGRTRSLEGKNVNTQTSYATPLRFGVFSEENKAVADSLLALLAEEPSLSGDGGHSFPSRSVLTGFSGTPNILPALSASGHSKEAWDMFTCTSLPSWLYPVTEGATSIWERWDSLDAAFSENPKANSMNSFNHFAPGSVGEWMYQYQLGITPGPEAGYKDFVLQPSCGGGFSSLRGSYESAYGRIESRWTADAEGLMDSYACLVPANTAATLYLPVCEEAEEFESGDWAVFLEKCTHNGILCACYRISSGSHEFTITESGISLQ